MRDGRRSASPKQLPHGKDKKRESTNHRLALLLTTHTRFRFLQSTTRLRQLKAIQKFRQDRSDGSRYTDSWVNGKTIRATSFHSFRLTIFKHLNVELNKIIVVVFDTTFVELTLFDVG